MKIGLFFGAVLIALILWSISRLKKDEFKFPKNLLSLSILLVLVSSLSSSIFSENPFISIFGNRLSASTFVGLLMLFVTSLLIGSMFSSKKSSYVATITVYFSLVLSLFINILYVFLGALPNFGFFLSNSVNTFGKWSDFGMISVLVVIISYLIIEKQKTKNGLKMFAWFGLVVSGISALVINEFIIWLILGALSIVYLVYKIVHSRKISSDSINKNLPYTTIAVILLSFVMILGGNIFSQFTDSWLNIVFTETKPGIESTLEVSKNVLSEKPILGVGENRFDRAWQVYKSDDINKTSYWGTDFVFGYSYLLSIPAKVGIFGSIAWLFFIIMVIWSIIKLLFKETDDFINSKLNLIHSFSILFVVLVLSMHIPSISVLVVSFAILGLFIGSLTRNKLYNCVVVKIDEKPKIGFLYIFSVIVLMIGSIYIGYMSARQFSSVILFEKANASILEGDYDGARVNLLNSVNVFTNEISLRGLSEYYQIEIGRLLQQGNIEELGNVDAFRELLSGSIAASSAAINIDRNNYINYVSLANIYEQLIQLGVEGSYEQSIKAYEAAREVNPKNPGLIVGMASAAFYAEKNSEAKEFISEALEINPMFVEAVYLLSRIQVSEGNIDDAIVSVQSSINIQPNDPNLYFQLGLLQYEQGEYQLAVNAFERSVILRPLFSNAKYFLGLSYDQVGRSEEAILQFEDLKLLNPENEEVDRILEQLKTGGITTKEEIEEIEELPLEETVEEE